jgi:hypothetical protein
VVFIGVKAELVSSLGVRYAQVWLDGAQWQNPAPPSPPVHVIVPTTTCRAGFEPLYGRCRPDCRQDPCKRIRVVEAQQVFRDSAGRTTGTATPDGSGGFVYRDAQGRTVGRSSTDSAGTARFWDEKGRSTGSATGPARPALPVTRP